MYVEDSSDECGFKQQFNNFGVFYNPYGTGGLNPMSAQGNCFCGFVPGKNGDAKMGEVVLTKSAGLYGLKGNWFCQLEMKDFKKQPKEKKTKEQKEKCKASASNAKDKKAAWKALRKQLKELRGQAKAAKQAYVDARSSREEDCA